jgi:hypothetical protein
VLISIILQISVQTIYILGKAEEQLVGVVDAKTIGAFVANHSKCSD